LSKTEAQKLQHIWISAIVYAYIYIYISLVFLNFIAFENEK